jgi:hypothetical protein
MVFGINAAKKPEKQFEFVSGLRYPAPQGWRFSPQTYADESKLINQVVCSLE